LRLRRLPHEGPAGLTMTEAYNVWFWLAMGYVLMVILGLAAFMCWGL
jgi:hypothetical protein